MGGGGETEQGWSGWGWDINRNGVGEGVSMKGWVQDYTTTYITTTLPGSPASHYQPLLAHGMGTTQPSRPHAQQHD